MGAYLDRVTAAKISFSVFFVLCLLLFSFCNIILNVIFNEVLINLILPVNKFHLFLIHSFILETYIAPLQETTTQRRSQPSHGQKRRTSERCKIWKGGPSARNAAQRGDHSMLMDPQSKRPFAK